MLVAERLSFALQLGQTTNKASAISLSQSFRFPHKKDAL
ncbi:hypothetical protein M2447_002259 [Ereboglobus sp. PH5-10]|nr:hypothetical protein [Ereboglobus sp. PH5-10]